MKPIRSRSLGLFDGLVSFAWMTAGAAIAAVIAAELWMKVRRETSERSMDPPQGVANYGGNRLAHRLVDRPLIMSQRSFYRNSRDSCDV
jgi:hypothetical protein